MKKKIFKKSKIKRGSKINRFFKKKKKLPQPFRFPNITRFFTEKFFLGSLISIALVTTLIFVSLDLYNDVKNQQKAEKERNEIISKIQYWKGIVDKYKDYRDAYFQLAILEYRLKNFDKSRSYVSKSLSIDPNFEKGRELEKILNVK